MIKGLEKFMRGLVSGELLKHIAALRKCIEQLRKLDAANGSSWSPELDGDIESADKALKFICDLFGVSSEVK